jgi:hypothetical protein
MPKNIKLGYIFMITCAIDLLIAAVLLLFGQTLPGLIFFLLAFAFLFYAKKYLGKDSI